MRIQQELKLGKTSPALWPKATKHSQYATAKQQQDNTNYTPHTRTHIDTQTHTLHNAKEQTTNTLEQVKARLENVHSKITTETQTRAHEHTE